MNFELSSPFSPTGDQPEAIAALSEGIQSGVPFQTLLGVTGSGKDVYYCQCDKDGTTSYFNIKS